MLSCLYSYCFIFSLSFSLSLSRNEFSRLSYSQLNDSEENKKNEEASHEMHRCIDMSCICKLSPPTTVVLAAPGLLLLISSDYYRDFLFFFLSFYVDIFISIVCFGSLSLSVPPSFCLFVRLAPSLLLSLCFSLYVSLDRGRYHCVYLSCLYDNFALTLLFSIPSLYLLFLSPYLSLSFISLSLSLSLSLPICLLFLVCLLISLVSLSRALTFSSDHSRFRVLYVCFSLAYDLCCLLFSLSFADAPTLCILSLVSLPSLSNNTSFDVSSLSICLPLFH